MSRETLRRNNDNRATVIAVFDIDGVLADDSATAKLNPAKPEDMAAFEKAIPALKPIKPLAAAAAALAKSGIPVFIFTARSARVRFETEDWLFAQGIDFKKLYMRPLGSNDTAVKLKTNMFKRLIDEVPDIDGIIFFEDNPAVCTAVKRNIDINAKAGEVFVCEVL